VTVLLFLKAPRPGFVKTRLAKSLGDDKACQIYRELVKQTLSQIPSDFLIKIHFAPADAREEMENWLGSDLVYSPQPEGDLGARLHRACEEAFAEPSTRGVILLGGDCPALTAAHLEECSGYLEESHSVIGPSEDGGYWLLGLPGPREELFNDVAWSTSEVLPTTLARLAARGEEPVLLEMLTDVDDKESWEKAQREFPYLEKGL